MIATLVCYLPLLAHPLATWASWLVPSGIVEIELVVCAFGWVGYTWLLPLSPFAALRYALPANLLSWPLGLFVYLGTLP
ncbi:MAG TPA: hypothetical protein VF384_09985 [Planctomycetota bacterium]